MRIFEGGSSANSMSINFVDDNDCYVGYCLEQQCCESAFYVINENWDGSDIDYDYNYAEAAYSDRELEAYRFDQEYFEGGNINSTFKLISEGKPDLYLHLINIHNGYYSHRFIAKVGGEVIHKGYV